MRRTRVFTWVASAACALTLSVAAPAWASGTTVYVAGLGATYGSVATDAGGNTCLNESTPCATVAYAISQGGADPTVAVAGYLGETGISVSSSDVTIEQDPLDPGDQAEIFAPSGNGGSIITISGTADLTVSDVTISSAQPSSNSGGGIADRSSGTLTLRNVIFNSDGAANDGGGVWVDGSGEVDISDSTFEAGYTSAGNGGAIAVDSAATVTVHDSTFAENTTEADGGAVYVADPNAADTTIIDSTFYNNAANGQISTGTLGTSADGNTIYADSATPEFAGDVFYGTCSMGGSDAVGDPVDDGYNAATDGSCLPAAGSRGPGDVVSQMVRDLYESLTFSSPGGLESVAVGAQNPASGMITSDTNVSLENWIGGGSGSVQLCPITDSQGVASSGACNAGASQTTVPRPDIYVEGSSGSDPNLGAANSSSTCGSQASPCSTIAAALNSSLALIYHYTDPVVEVDGTVDEGASSTSPMILDYPVTIEQDPDAVSPTATISGANGSNREQLFFLQSGAVTITGITLTDAAPAIYDSDSSTTDPVTLDGDTFSDDGSSSLEGGAIYIGTGSPVSIDGATFSDNEARDGGSLWIGDGASVHVHDSSFSGDTASDDGGGIALSVGATSGSTLWVGDSNFSYESAGSSGTGGAIDVASGSGAGIAHITDTVFANDSANQGGAIANGEYGSPGTIDVSGSIFFADTGFWNGGAISNGVYGGNGSTASATIDDSVFELDTSYGDGGAIDNADLGGSGIVTLSGADFYDNGVLASSADQIGPTWDGGAIDNGDTAGGYFTGTSGTLTAVGSTFYGNYVADGTDGAGAQLAGPAIAEGWTTGDSATVAGDLFDGVASALEPLPSGTNVAMTPLCTGLFTDDGYNAGTDATCFGSVTGDQTIPDLDSQLAVLQANVTKLGPVTLNTGADGSVPLVEPKLLGTSALLDLIPNATTSPIEGQQLCPVTDVLGDPAISGYGGGCAPGAFQSYMATAPTAGGYPTAVTAAAAGGGQATVSWTAPSLRAAGGQIDSYTVTPFDVTTGKTGMPSTTAGPITSLTVNALNGGDTYTFTVVTNNNALGSPESSDASAASNTVQVEAVTVPSGTTTGTNPSGTATTPSATKTTSPMVPKPTSTTSSVTLDRMRLTLTTPLVSSCTAPGRTVTIRITAARSGKTPLTFVKAVATLGSKQSTTLKHTPSGVTFKLKGLKAGRYAVKVVFSFRESLSRHQTRLVSRIVIGRLSVC